MEFILIKKLHKGYAEMLFLEKNLTAGQIGINSKGAIDYAPYHTSNRGGICILIWNRFPCQPWLSIAASCGKPVLPTLTWNLPTALINIWNMIHSFYAVNFKIVTLNTITFLWPLATTITCRLKFPFHLMLIVDCCFSAQIKIQTCHPWWGR